MSYDLYFRKKSSAPAFTQKAFKKYFSKRKNYELNEEQAFYSNEQTGVYFTFDFNDPEEENKADDDYSPDPNQIPVSFNINYYRPHVFGLEAEPELASFVKDFDLGVSDPQYEGMGDGAYSEQGFLSGWNAGNLFGHRAMLKSAESGTSLAPQLALPSSVLERHWRWNYTVDERQEAIPAFVPRISYALIDGAPKAFVVWGDAIPIALPEVDKLILVRRDIGKSRKSKTDSIALVDYADVEEATRAFPTQTSHGGTYRLMRYENAPKDLVAFFLAQDECDVQIEGLRVDQILSAEVLDKARRTE